MMDDLEQRLSAALGEGSKAAPAAHGLASAARSRATRTRRARVAGAGALAAVLVGVPGAVVALQSGDGGGRDGAVADGTAAPDETAHG
jgi:ferric-dicitrate binding protein FerR (iron transport regulator)